MRAQLRKFASDIADALSRLDAAVRALGQRIETEQPELIESSVAAWLQANPPQDGRTPSAEEITALIESFFVAFPGERDKLATPGDYPLPQAQIDSLRTAKSEELLNAGLLYIGGGKVTVADNVAILQLSNPAGSGKRLLMSKFYLASDITIDVNFARNATVAEPTVRSSDPLKLDTTVPAVGVLRTGITGYSVAGTAFSPVARLLANIRTEFELPISIPPGMSVSVAFAAGTLDTVNAYASAAWAEVPNS